MTTTYLDSIQRLFRSYKAWNKCFCIGSNKTGTSSLQGVMRCVLGFRANQGDVETYASIQCMKGNYNPLKEIMNEFDFHKDVPASQGNVYAILDAIFPNSKFILTTRETKSWAKSFASFYAKYFYDALMIEKKTSVKLDQSQFPGYGALWITHYWKEELEILRGTSLELGSKVEARTLIANNQRFLEAISTKFDRRNKDIINYFRLRKKDLLILDISKSQSISSLLEFLELPSIIDCEWPRTKPISNDKSAPKNTLDHQIHFLKKDSLSSYLNC